MIGELTYEKDKITNPLSAYQPSKEVKELYQICKESYEEGDEIMRRPFNEFNNRSLVSRMNEDQKAWLSWTPDRSDVPEEGWQWNGVRPITRNKVISTAAHLTSQLIYPAIFAQNDQDEEDRDAAYVAKELIEYNIRNSSYETTFLYGVISGLVNPVTYWEVDYVQEYQTILEGTNSNYTKKEVIDDVLSGFQNNLRTADEIFIANPYQFELQRQRFLIKRRLLSHKEAQGKWGNHDNWQYVKPGLRVLMGNDSLFYDIEDVNNNLIEELTFYYRKIDREVTFINGIYFGGNNTEFNPFSHRTNKNQPRYQFVKFGSEPIDAKRFFYYKSLVAKMSNDQEAIDREWKMYFDASFLATYPPVITSGAGKIDRSVVIPAMVTDLPRDSQINPLNIVNPSAAAGALREAERSLNESSQDPQSQGAQQGPQKTAKESILLQENAEVNLGPIGRMIGEMVREIGVLMLDNILRYQTVGEVTEILGGIPKMKFRSFILNNKNINGKNRTEIIKFTNRFADKSYSKEEKEDEELRMFQETGDDKHLWEVNPAQFHKFNFLVVIDYEQLFKRNTAFERAFKLEIYDRAIQNPYVDQQLITRDFLMEPLVKGEASKYMKEVEGALGGLVPEMMGKGSKGLTERITQSTALERSG